MMNEPPTPTSSPADFFANAERLLTPVYAECFTDETRKVKNLLLVTSIVLILFVFGVVAVGKAVDVPLLALSITVRTGMRWILMALCAYFLLLLGARSYIEWKLWQLRNQAPMVALGNLKNTILNSWIARTNQADAKLALSLDTFLRRTEELKVEPVAESPLKQQRDELFQEFEKSRNELAKKRDLSEERDSSPEYRKVLYHYYNLFEELDDLDRQIREEREKQNEQRWAKGEALTRQLDQAREDHLQETSAPDLASLEEQLNYLLKAIEPLKKVKIVRLWFEMLFPLFLGLSALVLGFVVRGSG